MNNLTWCGSVLAAQLKKARQSRAQTVDKALAISPELYYFQCMLKRKTSHQSEMGLGSIESLVPEDHLLRKIDEFIDFDFIYDKAEHLYCKDNFRWLVRTIFYSQ